MTVCIFPPLGDRKTFDDVLSRVAWHFDHVTGVDVVVPVTDAALLGELPTVPPGFDHEVARSVRSMHPRLRFVHVADDEECKRLLADSRVVLKHIEGDEHVESALRGISARIYRVDPHKVRQEGSFYIQAAHDLLEGSDSRIQACKENFLDLKSRLGRFERSWVLATGPTVENYKHQDFVGDLGIVCNSTILDQDLMDRVRPKLLVFADPIFHFGVSQYAGDFRREVRRVLEGTDIVVVVPFKYYPLLVSKFPEYGDRIIGIPFRPRRRFNLDIGGDFELKVTANILTLLLLPLATTFSMDVGILGCDGRPLEDDDYFWGHAQTTQINGQMQNIQEVHPGFFKIDYNEYYFEHCHTLENLIAQGEDQGCRFRHFGPSHIPALRDRTTGVPVDLDVRQPDVCVLAEPDGIGTSGHYVAWHNHLVEAMEARGSTTRILCNRKQNPDLYQTRAIPTFTSHSWAVSRTDAAFRRGFHQDPAHARFREELVAAILGLKEEMRELRMVSLFVYYGSVQVLKAVQGARVELAKAGLDLRASVCLFHESVFLDNSRKEPRFPPEAKAILLESAAQVDNYRIFSVTGELAEHILDRFGVATEVLPNPIPNESGAAAAPDPAAANGLAAARAVALHGGEKPVVLFPCRPRPEKGGAITEDFLRMAAGGYVGDQGVYLARGPIEAQVAANVKIIGEEVTESEYRGSFEASDIVVIPYLSPHFKYRTSGIVVDALAAGKPCIVLDETWLATVVKGLRCGLAVNYRDSTSIASAIATIRRNYAYFSENAVRAYAKYRQAHSWERMADRVSL